MNKEREREREKERERSQALSAFFYLLPFHLFSSSFSLLTFLCSRHHFSFFFSRVCVLCFSLFRFFSSSPPSRRKQTEKNEKKKSLDNSLKTFLLLGKKIHSRLFARLDLASTTNPANTLTSRKRLRLAWTARARRSRKAWTSSVFAKASTAATCNVSAKLRLLTAAFP